MPTIEPFGQFFAAASAGLHSACALSASSESVGGIVTTTFFRAASALVCVTVAENGVVLFCVVDFGSVIASVSWGFSGRSLQPPTWNRELTAAVWPSAEPSVALIDFSAQEVGFRMNPGLSTETFRFCNRTGTPLTIVGSGSLTIVTCASCGST